MSKNITISSFKNIPKGLFIAVALFLLTECFVYSNRAELTKDYWNKFLLNEHTLLDSPGDYDYLIMGDSIQKTGIQPLLVDEKMLNLGLPGGKPMSLYIMLKRYLENHRPPKVIFLYIDPEDSRDSLNVILRYFVKIPEFISIWKDLTPKERQIFMTRYLATLDLRKVNLTQRDDYPYDNETFVKGMKKNHGYLPSPQSGISISEDYFVNNRARCRSGISLSRNDMKYLGKFMKLAASKNTKIVFLGFLLPRELYDILEKTGFNKEYRAFYEKLQKIYPEWSYVKEPIYYMDNKYFGDKSHLNREGSEIYTDYFKNEIFRPVKERL